MAVALIVASIGLMYKSTDGLSIGWVRGAGPGSGAWPFWISTIMLLSAVAILARAWKRVTPASKSEEPFMDWFTVRIIGITVLALALLLVGTHFVGLYVSLIAFLFFYIKVVGRHSLLTSLALALAIPIVVFFFFEYLLVIPLPKGITEPLFYPIYDLMY
ncbi:MAG: tripartite tricarboxylate transporter TctB family protein [Rhodospirillales bacterium]|nr:tripartite tricarboxylate transporter TctB family protein [Rhodospirillales bacterium]